MTPAALILNVAVLIIVLYRNVGVHLVTRRRYAIPAAIIVVVGLIFLRNVPSGGNDVRFDAVGLIAGVLPGVVAGHLLRLEITNTGQLLSRAGAWFTVLWIVVIAARVGFSEGATHLYSRQITTWSEGHQISG